VHTVEIDSPNVPNALTTFANVTANSLGQANAIVGSLETARLPNGAVFAIRLGLHGGDNNGNLAAAERIATTGPLADDPSGQTYQLQSTDITPFGVNLGTPAGKTTLTYDPNGHTLTVQLMASGLTPGNHATHVHSGGCMAQGAVKYMPPQDFVANQQGVIDQIQVIQNVMTDPLVSGYYLNIHQGNSASILQNGMPALSFRPLLCGDL
jgi:hypothetical protein